MREDPRCCGSGTCIIDTEGRCWCGQRWDGEKMCHVPERPGDKAVPVDAHMRQADPPRSAA